MRSRGAEEEEAVEKEDRAGLKSAPRLPDLQLFTADVCACKENGAQVLRRRLPFVQNPEIAFPSVPKDGPREAEAVAVCPEHGRKHSALRARQYVRLSEAFPAERLLLLQQFGVSDPPEEAA